MTIWLALWLSLSFILIVFLVWTTVIMFSQKKTWKAFAQKHKLRYKLGAFFTSPEVNGVFQDYTISIFGSEHEVEDARSVRKMSAIEVMLKSKFPLKGAVGTGEMVRVIRSLAYHDEVKPTIKGWKDSFIALSENEYAMSHYLSEERLKALLPLMNAKKMMVIFIFTKTDTLLRIDTPEPLDNLEYLDKIIDGMVGIAKTLELRDGEGRTMMAQKSLAPLHTRPDTPDQKPSDTPPPIAFEFEEDAPEQGGEEPLQDSDTEPKKAE